MRRVECLKHTSPDLAELAARTCTATTEKCSPTIGGAVNFLKGLIDSGHESVIEHLVYTFSIKGVSRALLQELAPPAMGGSRPSCAPSSARLAPAEGALVVCAARHSLA